MTDKEIQTINLSGFLKTAHDRVSDLGGKKVLIIGDVGLDEYVIGTVKRISPEAPVPVVEVQRQDRRMGLAANVAANVTSLGGEAFLVGVVGEDATANQLADLLSQSGIAPEYLVSDMDRPTTRKARIMTENQQVVRVDYEKRRFLTPEVEARLLSRIEGLLPTMDIVVIEDYAKGLLSKNVSQKIIQMANKSGKMVLVDPHRTTPIDYYENATLIKPNKDEAMALSGIAYDDLRDNFDVLTEAGRVLAQKTKAKQVVITAGREGMRIYDQNGSSHIPTFARDVFDVTGAGDTVIATLSLALSAGLGLQEACVMANFAAGVVVGQVGSVTCSPAELIKYIEQHILSSGV